MCAAANQPPDWPDLGDEQLLAGLRTGDAEAFAALVNRHHAALIAVAERYVGDHSVAEDVVQDTWLAVIAGLPRFAGRSRLSTWIFRIVRNRAISRAAAERRVMPMSAVISDDWGPVVAPGRFSPPDYPAQPGHWLVAPRVMGSDPEEEVLSTEGLSEIASAARRLPAAQRAVFLLRDRNGFSTREISRLLDLTAGNQRVLLHRARSRLRASIEEYFDRRHPESPRAPAPVPPLPDDPRCIDVVELLSDYLEGTLSQRQRATIDAHLNRCDGCAVYLEQMRLAVKSAGRFELETVHPDTRDALLTAFRKALEEMSVRS